MTKFLLTLIIPLVMISAPVFAQSIGGTVKSVSDGSPIPGVSVTVKGKTLGALTNSQGQYKLAISGENTLIFSAIGYKTLEVATAGRTTVDVTLEEATSSLNEVVVTAMGIAKESRKLGYATTQISAKDITATSPTNFASALYGKAPGVTINANPGGATSAVGIQIRGVNSIGYQRQPLLVVDGVIIRNGDANNEGYWNNQKIGANGLLDINPENIQDINILKGAAASALYGSDANFGVIVITTKNGKSIKKGIGVDVSLSGNVEKVSTVPDFQTEWGPGYERSVNMASFGADDQGWIHTTVNGQSVKYPNFRSYAQFGPKMDGSDVYWWDGQMRKYTTQKNNWKQFYRTGSSTIATVALSNATDRGSYRLSFTRNDYQGIQIGGKQEKNTFNLNTKYFVTPKVTLDVVMNYVNEKVHNRPRQIYYLTNNFGGFFSPADQMSVFFNKYQTSKGYKWVDYNSNLDVEERLKYNVRAKDFLDFLWNQLANKYDETSNRFMPSATLNYNIVKGLNLRGRMGIDYTSFNQETKERSTQPISAGASGSYGTVSNNSTYTYGDLLLTYERQLSQKLNATISVGYQARKEKYNFASASTRDGLTSENWFSLSASKTSPAQGSTSVEMLLKDGMFGILNLEYNNFLFVEGTLRRERSSSLAPGNNTFVYPGVSSSFELSNAFNLPAAVSYSKLRGAWGVVGNPPDRYIANQVYSSGSLDGTPYLFPATSGFGNKNLKNEMKYEFEIGWENRFLKDRAGFDITYYSNKIKDQITTLGTPSTIGSSSVLRNVGDMRNYGIELSLYGTPVKSSHFSWNARLNFAMNRSKVISLADGLAQLTLDNKDNGSLYVYAKPGEAAGSIWGYDHMKDAKGNYVVGDDGFYQIDYSKLVKFGNIQSKFSGGLMNTFTYKNFSLGVLTDFVWGGQVISLSRLYGTGSGLYKNSLFGRDAEHGGVAYYKDATTGKLTGVGAGVDNGPKGEKVYHDGIIAQGVTTGGEKNATIVEAPQYYRYHYNWGGYPGSGSNITYKDAVFDNNFIKLREVSLSYTIPSKALSKLKIQNVTVSAYGRNLFYFYKSLTGLDPEEGVGTGWVSRATSVGAGNAATRSIGGSLRFSF
ncbi:SusC/RagA family TonB-linked outer membrane protein [Siphonobacter aquaeclarae]|uniref:TonB-linked outer membrane protein, SusC/RagA family n=1 Tax=Siphonobacter aquaeclarae TaxID=563176 RepID=A0A1G9VBN1_9BACT|nr:SusC/RagA family TonB-linked outer membrane protein [Siphonobacter aquaeclarae]SDM69531.1 TonB-linked outer membrane protein, SusC/RagA family [Siphonobacter aquaeclarae]